MSNAEIATWGSLMIHDQDHGNGAGQPRNQQQLCSPTSCNSTLNVYRSLLHPPLLIYEEWVNRNWVSRMQNRDTECRYGINLPLLTVCDRVELSSEAIAYWYERCAAFWILRDNLSRGSRLTWKSRPLLGCVWILIPLKYIRRYELTTKSLWYS